MTRLDYILNGPKGPVPIRYPEDVALLKLEIPELAALSDEKVQELYSDWSEDAFCAGWLYVSSSMLSEFRDYLREEV